MALGGTYLSAAQASLAQLSRFSWPFFSRAMVAERQAVKVDEGDLLVVEGRAFRRTDGQPQHPAKASEVVDLQNAIQSTPRRH